MCVWMLVCLYGNVDVCMGLCGCVFTCVDVNVCVVCVNVCLRVWDVDVWVGVWMCVWVGCVDVSLHV